MTATQEVYFLDSRFDAGSIEDAVQRIIAERDGPFKYVVTPNVHNIVTMHDDGGAMIPLYNRAWLSLCDSRVLSRLARFKSLDLPVVPGSDLTARVVARAAELGLRIAIVGPTAEDCAILKQKYPTLHIASYTPPMGFIKSEREIEKCIDFVVATQAELVFLAVGMPQQLVLADRIADNPDARGVGLCIGASIDFLTGKQQRAPVWIQNAGLEWAHRLLGNPRRLARRYLIESPRIFYLMVRAPKTAHK